MLKRVITIIFLITLIIMGCSKSEEAVEKVEFQGAREVKVVFTELSDISSYIEYSGKIQAEEAINIKPAIGGKIVEYKVQEGSVVKKGDLLVILDDTQLRQAQTQFKAMEKNYQRMQELYKTGAVDNATLDEVEAGFQVAETSYIFILENTYILAPIDGVVTIRYKKEGEHFDAMMDPLLLRMVNLEKIKAVMQVSDTDINKLETEQEVILMTNNSEQEFTGTISFVSPEADMMSGSFSVEMLVNNQDNLLHNNQFVNIKVLTQTSRNTVVIPQQAVINNEYVFILEKGKARKKLVTLGLENEYQIEITSGIDEGVEVVIIGNAGLSDNDKVKVKN